MTVGTLVNIQPSDSHAEKEPSHQRSLVELVLCEKGGGELMRYMFLLESGRD